MTGPQLSSITLSAAVIPLVLVLVLMVRYRWGGATAGLAGTSAAAVLGWLVFGADISLLLTALWKGTILSFHVLYIIWPALILYHVVEESGAIRSIAIGVSSLTKDHILQLLILGFAFSSFLQGVAGFGVPVAVVAPLLIGLGFPPIQATVIPLVGHSWAVTMGDLASSFQALLAVTGLPGRVLGLWTALFLGIACIVSGFAVAHIHAGFLPIRRCLGAILALSLSMGLTQFALAYWEHWLLASFCAGMVGLATSLLVAKISRGEVPSLLGLFPTWPSPWGRRTPHEEISSEFRRSEMSFHLAFSAYYALIVIVTAGTVIPVLHDAANSLITTFEFPRTVTSLGWITEPSRYHLSLFGHPGAYLSYTIGVSWLIYRLRGYLERDALATVLRQTSERGVPTSFGVLFMVVMAMIMDYSGMTFLLAQGAIALTGSAYPLLSPFVGMLGCFMTGSNTNSNVLFGVLQRDAALLLGKDAFIMVALQTTGGALGSMIAPAKVLVACATAGLQGREGEVLALAMKYCIPITLFISLLGWLILSVV